MAIQNRYEFMYYVACTNCNPNGDPDMGNMPRLDPQTMQGFITDAATKRRIRNYVELAHKSGRARHEYHHPAGDQHQPPYRGGQAGSRCEDCAKAKEPFTRAEKKACELFLRCPYLRCSHVHRPYATRGSPRSRCRSPTEKVWTPFFRWTFPSPVWRSPTR